MRKYLPVMIDISNRKILLIGAGKAGLEKLRTFSQLDTIITVISKEFHPDFYKFSNLKCIERPYQLGDMDDYDIVYCGVNDQNVTQQIKEEANIKKKMINFIDKPLFSDFISASSMIYENFTIFLSTYGKAPGAAKKIRETIEKNLNLNEIDEMVKVSIIERENYLKKNNV